jgi:hypothetical protein
MADSPQPPGHWWLPRDDQREASSAFDASVPSTARMYDYYLGGKDNFAADRMAAEQALSVVPQGRRIALANRHFLARAVLRMTEQGIRQFIDLGTGIPTRPSVHEIARQAVPDARVVYVDNDPVVTTHNRACLTADEGIRAIHGDIREPGAILGNDIVRRLVDFNQPVGVLLVAVLHFITDDEGPERIIRAFTDHMVPGSYLALSHITSDGTDPDAMTTIKDAYADASAPAVFRTTTQIREFFAGFTLEPPGLIDVAEWFPYAAVFSASPRKVRFLGGLGRKARRPTP